MIEDGELRGLFKIESAEHLQRLDQCLLSLEKDPRNADVLSEALREAHSMKGAAHMLGLGDIETLSHRMEDLLAAANRGEILLSPTMMDGLSRALEALRRLCAEAVTGEASGVSVAAVLGELKMELKAASSSRKGGAPGAVFEGARPPETIAAPAAPPAPAEEKVAPHGGAAAPERAEDFRIETIRVETRKLDALHTLVGELTVVKIRIARRLMELDEVIDLVGAGGQAGDLLRRLRGAMHEDSARLDVTSAGLEDGVRAMRLLPLSMLFSLFPRLVRDLAREQGKEARLLIEGAETTVDKRVIEELKDPLMHILRNAVDHGVETLVERSRKGKPAAGVIVLRAFRSAAGTVVEVEDDGAGLDAGTLRQTALKRRLVGETELASLPPEAVADLIFISGFSTSAFVTDVSGRGVGLDVVRTNVERLKGTARAVAIPGRGLLIRIELPLTLATARVLILAAAKAVCALPVEAVRTVCRVHRRDIFTIEGRDSFLHGDRPVSLARLADLLEFPPGAAQEVERLPCVVLAVGEEQLGLLVDDVLDEQEIVLKPYGALLHRVRNVSGATILGTGEVCMVLNPADLLRSARRRGAPAPAEQPAAAEVRRKSLLLAEDSLTTRTQMQRILEGAGYEVTTAVDGMDAYTKLGTRPFDALVSDILMPNLDGLSLTAKIRAEKRYHELPVILVTSLASETDRRKGVEAGANAYITKPAFDQKVLLDALKRLI